MVRMLSIAAAALLTFALAGCAGPNSAATPSPTKTDAATALLTTTILPREARSAAATIDAPAEKPECDPLDIATSDWLVPNATLESLTAFLAGHPVASLPHIEKGNMTTLDGTVLSASVADSADGSPSMLVFTFQPGTGGIDLRVDAEIVPPGSSCVRSQPAMPATND
jgi:hypothetical protein